MIDRVHFENFKSLADVTIDLGRFTVLVGPNGCGKSSVLQAMHLLSKTGRTLDAEPPGGPSRLGRFDRIFGGSHHPQRLARNSLAPLAIEMRRSTDTMRVTVIKTADGFGPGVEVTLVGRDGDLSTSLPVKDKDWAGAKFVLNHPRSRAFSNCAYLRLDARLMTTTAVPADETPRMHSDGEGLASALAWMKGAAEEELAQLTTALARVVPGVRRIRTLRERVTTRRMDRIDVDGQPVWRPIDESVLGDRFELEFTNGISVPADLLSEGTVLVLGLLTKLHEPQHPWLILLDDLDRGLHLGAQAALVGILRSLLESELDLQIVCTTHSPYLLDLFKPEEVRVMALDSGRRTRVRALSEHPDIEKWKFGTQTGELWATLGEAWVLEAGGG